MKIVICNDVLENGWIIKYISHFYYYKYYCYYYYFFYDIVTFYMIIFIVVHCINYYLILSVSVELNGYTNPYAIVQLYYKYY